MPNELITSADLDSLTDQQLQEMDPGQFLDMIESANSENMLEAEEAPGSGQQLPDTDGRGTPTGQDNTPPANAEDERERGLTNDDDIAGDRGKKQELTKDEKEQQRLDKTWQKVQQQREEIQQREAALRQREAELQAQQQRQREPQYKSEDYQMLAKQLRRQAERAERDADYSKADELNDKADRAEFKAQELGKQQQQPQQQKLDDITWRQQYHQTSQTLAQQEAYKEVTQTGTPLNTEYTRLSKVALESGILDNPVNAKFVMQHAKMVVDNKSMHAEIEKLRAENETLKKATTPAGGGYSSETRGKSVEEMSENEFLAHLENMR